MYTKSISAVTKNQNFQLKEIFTGIKHYHKICQIQILT